METLLSILDFLWKFFLGCFIFSVIFFGTQYVVSIRRDKRTTEQFFKDQENLRKYEEEIDRITKEE